jgi:hypothetical protein
VTGSKALICACMSWTARSGRAALVSQLASRDNEYCGCRPSTPSATAAQIVGACDTPPSRTAQRVSQQPTSTEAAICARAPDGRSMQVGQIAIVLTWGLVDRVSLKESSCSTHMEREPAQVKLEAPRLAKIQIVVLPPSLVVAWSQITRRAGGASCWDSL